MDTNAIAQNSAAVADSSQELISILRDAPEAGGGPNWDKEKALGSAKAIAQSSASIADSAGGLL
ncbi:hypothetical protein [Streptomyces sp. NPDC091268]|uniref:hypothetical protein n=1 Tax=Streptomyces sp. NPDC091268 TaxID=3365979 RepID=UPI00382EF1CB